MSWTHDYRARTGVEYTPPIYLPRLQGAEAIPKLTHTKFRSSCSPNCIHSWRPRPPPPTPPPPPINPMNVYKLHFMRHQLYGLDESGSFRIEPNDPPTPTKYDLLMRNVVLGLKPTKQQQHQAKLPYRASTSSIRESVHRRSLKRVKSEVIRRSKLKERKSLALRKPCYVEEVALLARHNEQLIKREADFTGNYWKRVDALYANLERLDTEKSQVMSEYPEHIAAFYTKFITRHSQRQAQEELLREELDAIKDENEQLANEIVKMKQYTRIGRQRDQAEIDQLRGDIDQLELETQQSLASRPFVTPEIVMPRIAPLPAPPITQLLEAKVENARDCVDLLMAKIEDLKLQKSTLKKSQRETRDEFVNEPKTYQNHDDNVIPVLDIPMRRELRF